MENASKALLMAAGLLIALLIIYIAVRVFTSASGVSQSYHDRESASEIATFNSHFTKYVGAVVKSEELTTQTYATIHDIITVANFAWDYNYTKAKAAQINPIEHASDLYGLIKVDLYTVHDQMDKDVICENIQNKTDEAYEKLIQGAYYIDQYSPNSKRVATYEIRIVNYDAEGRIIEVRFYPSARMSSDTNESNGYDEDTVNGILRNAATRDKFRI